MNGSAEQPHLKMCVALPANYSGGFLSVPPKSLSKLSDDERNQHRISAAMVASVASQDQALVFRPSPKASPVKEGISAMTPEEVKRSIGVQYQTLLRRDVNRSAIP